MNSFSHRATLVFMFLLLGACGSTLPNPNDVEAARQAKADHARNAADRAQQQLKGIANPAK